MSRFVWGKGDLKPLPEEPPEEKAEEDEDEPEEKADEGVVRK